VRVAFVTGGSGGIGRAAAVALAGRGDRVAFCYARDEDRANETRAELSTSNRDVLALRCDVGDPDAVDAAFTTIEAELGPVEILVNNAGITADGLVARMTDDQWDRVIRTDLTGAFNTIRRAVPRMMRARFGRIVNVSSVGGHLGGPGQANYSAAKAGLLGLSRSVARELATRGITCNVVAPGPIDTPMTAPMAPEWRERANAAVPMQRFGSSDEVGGAIAFLSSDEAGYITGALLPVDGGLGMGH
jgi:3-oxoacyl-[acyl-carrier protein] reductase